MNEKQFLPNIIPMKLFGIKLKELRLKRGLYQRDIAQEMKISSTAISKWEKNIQEPSFDNLVKLCDILETTPNYLFGFED